ncbi:FxsB family cyclophane-forming radical SAM/SPASM peptide maturase [Streptacidiphilus albus]|uniref:FxsB family cyclophane-forming radical SAM/SPASM peptide maturase n=1 Tax=Streptacidiphilus albus TaxID=105425 RepID=UPI000A8025A4|nr:FxsB family cyclophane-forming radical SAM/SPASM peptide maturase [Streptacidiphilus albus]
MTPDLRPIGGPVVPLRQFVLKLHSRCDLACDHCYVYEHQDSSWRGRPGAASDAVLRAAAARIAEHARSHALPVVYVVLHGGEPLLAGHELLRRAAEILHRALDGVAELDLCVHTNGVRLDEAFCELFLHYGIRVGISLDGDRRANDLHRRYRNGRSSHAEVMRAVQLLKRPRYRHLFAGLLCTVDVRNDPRQVYDALVELAPPQLDFLLPHATWDRPPLRPEGVRTPYADWLRVVHERWEEDGRAVPVRIFESLHQALAGGRSRSESFGLEPVDLVVIEVDGTLEQADSLKTAFDGAPATGLDVFADSFDEIAAHPGILARQQGLDGLCRQCRDCPVVRACGGGLYAHRYRSEPGGGGFDHPSVYCDDLLDFIGGLEAADAARTARRTGPSGTAAPVHALVLREEQFAELAQGPGSAEAVQALAESQGELNRGLLARVIGLCPDDQVPRLLTALDAQAPAALDAVLAQPFVQYWLRGCLDLPGGFRGADVEAALARTAAAAVLHAGWHRPVPVPVRRNGVLSLPTWGRVVFDRIPGDPVPVDLPPSADPATALADWAERVGGRWEPLRRLVVDGTVGVALEDTDPAAGMLPVERPDESGFAAWEAALREAWRIVGARLPAYAGGLAAGLRSIVPQRPGAPGEEVSGTPRYGFGAVGIARPVSAERLALLLVHELQHVKLDALLDLDRFCLPDAEVLIPVGWRPDPRPPEGVLQGVYAHLAVMDYWMSRARSDADPDALRRHERLRSEVTAAAEQLRGSRALTDIGSQFLEWIEMRLKLTD